MAKTRIHARLIQHPFTPGLQGAYLDSFHEKINGNRTDIILEYQALEKHSTGLVEKDGTIYENISGTISPAQLRFIDVREIRRNDFYDSLPAHSDERIIIDLLAWKQPERTDTFYLLSLVNPKAKDMMFFAQQVVHERTANMLKTIKTQRDWCPPPPMPDRLLPEPKSIHAQFGGDPVTVCIGSRQHHRRLFIGGIEIQPDYRPNVDIVLNFGEEPSRWVTNDPPRSEDRWDNKGEGQAGMSLDELRSEAKWVINQLHGHKRLLVHCAAGMNRSATICCAVLILMEGLSAEQALARVRKHHPWARPDSRHWLKLRWLAEYG